MVALLFALVAIFTFVTFSKIVSVCKRNIHDTPEDITTKSYPPTVNVSDDKRRFITIVEYLLQT